MLKLERAPVEIAHINFYTENHGDEKAHGIALKIALRTGASVLDLFQNGLRAALYRAPDDISKQQTDGDVLRFPRLSSLALDNEIAGARVQFEVEGLFEAEAVVFADAQVDKFRPTLREGGAVDWVFRVKAQPDADQVAALYEMQGRIVLLTLTPPEAATYAPTPDAQPDMLDEEEGGDDTADAVAAAWASEDAKPKGRRGRKGGEGVVA